MRMRMSVMMRRMMMMRTEEMLRVALLVAAVAAAGRAILPEPPLSGGGGGEAGGGGRGGGRGGGGGGGGEAGGGRGGGGGGEAGGGRGGGGEAGGGGFPPEEEQLPAGDARGTEPDLSPAAGREAAHESEQLEMNMESSSEQEGELRNNIQRGCSADEDCVKGTFCLSETHESKCVSCKAVDVSCSRDEQCCGDQLCVWGQCRPNATRGDAGSTCRRQVDCGAELCCAVHAALLFPVCMAKPIERERCFTASNHLMALLSWDVRDGRPRTHCPCAGGLHCQHLGRGSMCLKGEESSEEDLADTLYSEIDYII